MREGKARTSQSSGSVLCLDEARLCSVSPPPRNRSWGGYSGPSIAGTISLLMTSSSESSQTGLRLKAYFIIIFIRFVHFFFFNPSCVFPDCSLRPGTKIKKPRRGRWSRQWRRESSRTCLKMHPRVPNNQPADAVLPRWLGSEPTEEGELLLLRYTLKKMHILAFLKPSIEQP